MDFKEEVLKLGIDLNDIMLEKFDKYYNKLIEVNEYMNLTAITEKSEVFKKHFLDSLEIIKAIDISQPFNLCDVGSGAGFPSIPLAITCGNANVTIIDALNKRIKFLNELCEYINLDNVKSYHYRAEEYVKEKREYFDYVTARAVARLNILLELCMPLVKVGGSFIAMKGASGVEELNEAKKAISILGGEINSIISFNLPDDGGKREIIIIKKISEGNLKYPRSFAKIKEKPL